MRLLQAYMYNITAKFNLNLFNTINSCSSKNPNDYIHYVKGENMIDLTLCKQVEYNFEKTISE